MVLQTETFDLADEVARLEEDLGETESLLDDVDGQSQVQRELSALKGRLEVQLSGVRWASEEAADADYCPVWSEDVDAITLAGLTGGGVAQTSDELPADAGQGARRVNFVASGSPHPGDDDIRDRPAIDVPAPAPYVDAKPSEQSQDERVAVVSDLPDPYLRWAYARIDELTTVGGNGSVDFDRLRGEIEAMSTETSNSTT